MEISFHLRRLRPWVKIKIITSDTARKGVSAIIRKDSSFEIRNTVIIRTNFSYSKMRICTMEFRVLINWSNIIGSLSESKKTVKTAILQLKTLIRQILIRFHQRSRCRRINIWPISKIIRKRCRSFVKNWRKNIEIH